MFQRCTLVLLASTVWLASCGGGSSGTTTAPAATTAAVAAVSTAAAALRASPRPAAAADGPIDAEDAANQLMDFAEVHYPQYFPGHPATAQALGYTYRYYADTDIHLGVREGRVYVLGGAFGTEVSEVGELTQFITPAPRQLSGVCAAGGTHASFVTPGAAVGRNAAATLAGCSGAITGVQWRQTAGPAVTLLSAKSQTISFDPPEAGDYGFELSFIGADGLARTEQVLLPVAAAGAAAGPRITVRASQSARMGGAVSVRAWPTVPEGDSVKAVTWMQIEGPAVTLDTRTPRLALFTAPEVARDTVVRLRATMHTAAGLTASDEVLVLVERLVQPDNENALWSGEHVPRVYAYKSGGRYAGVLRQCVYDPSQAYSGPNENLCTLSRLPFLGQDTAGATPTVDQVMDRVLVSHDWLGQRFEDYLRTHDANGDVRRMLNSVTAVVLSTHVRPSFYYAATGAIYLDADSFWMTPEERDTVNEAPDYRSDFGNVLQYQTTWRYVQDGRSLFAFYDPEQRVARTLDAVRDEAGWLLFHELSHALDYLPPADYPGLLRGWTVWENLWQRYGNNRLTSDTVPLRHPLTSSVMHGLAQVRFRGEEATAAERAYTPDQVASHFGADVATDDYSYTSQFEDIAMTLEEVLMQRRHGARRDFAITDAYDRGSATGSTIIVRWGQRGRVGEPAIHPRARLIAQELVPWFDSNEIALLPPPLALRPGESWTANLQQPAPPRRALAAPLVPTVQQLAQFRHELRRMQHHRHLHARRVLPPPRAH